MLSILSCPSALNSSIEINDIANLPMIYIPVHCTTIWAPHRLQSTSQATHRNKVYLNTLYSSHLQMWFHDLWPRNCATDHESHHSGGLTTWNSWIWQTWSHCVVDWKMHKHHPAMQCIHCSDTAWWINIYLVYPFLWYWTIFVGVTQLICTTQSSC